MFQLRSRRQLQLGATKATPLKAVGTVPTLTSREAGHVGPHRSRTCEACLSGVADHEAARCPTCTAPSNGRMRSLTTLPGTKVAARPTTDVRDDRKLAKKTGVALLTRHRGHCEPLWAVIPPLQVVLSSACSVASLGRFPSHYLPGRPHLRKGVLADHLFGWGTPSTRQAGHVTVHSASSVKSPCGAQGGMTLPNKKDTRRGNCGRFGKELIFACPRWPFVRTCPDLSGRVRTCPDVWAVASLRATACPCLAARAHLLRELRTWDGQVLDAGAPGGVLRICGDQVPCFGAPARADMLAIRQKSASARAPTAFWRSAG